MRQTIPFSKDITFKTKIGEITAISLNNDLELQGEDLVKGSFYISGNYKMLESSTVLEDYSYKVPCEIAISDDYDTFDASVDIDDFNYEIIDDDVLRINIVVAIDNLKKKEVLETINSNDEFDDIIDENPFDKEIDKLDRANEILDHENTDKEVIKDLKEDSSRDNKISFYDVKESVKKQSDTYLTYKIYIYKDGDSIEDIIEKYNITKEDLLDYNDLDNVTVGMKIVIPSINA